MPYNLPAPPGTPAGLPAGKDEKGLPWYFGLASLLDRGSKANPMVGSIATEPIEGNSLTQLLRSFQNYLMTTGESGYGYGQQLTAQGAGGLAGASATAQPAVDYWTKLLSGDPKAMDEAVAPEASKVSDLYRGASNTASGSMPRGGFRSATMANLPFQQAKDVGNLYFGLRPQAAQGVYQGAGIQGQLAQALGQLGLGQMTSAQNMLNLGGQSASSMRGQDVAEHGQAMSMATQLAMPFAQMGASLTGAGAMGELDWLGKRKP